jgi:hypothetical protein
MSCASRKRVRSHGCPGSVDPAAVFEFLLKLKPRALRRCVRSMGCGDEAVVPAPGAAAVLVFECTGACGESIQAPCDAFIEWLVCSVLCDIDSYERIAQCDDDMHLLSMFADHEGLRGAMLRCSLLPPLICQCFRLYFDMLSHCLGQGGSFSQNVQLWLQVLLRLIFKLCSIDSDGPEVMLICLQRSGSEDFAFIIRSLSRIAADNLKDSASSPPVGGSPSPIGDGVGFMNRCAAALGKGRECAGCLSVDICSMLCCTSSASVSYAIHSQALKPSLVMNLTLLLFQRLASPNLQHQHERLAVSWLVNSRHKHSTNTPVLVTAAMLFCFCHVFMLFHRSPTSRSHWMRSYVMTASTSSTSWPLHAAKVYVSWLCMP